MFDELLEKIKKDGARHFVDLPLEFAFFDDMAEHTESLYGVELIEFMTDGIVEMWMEFEFRGHRFTVNNGLTDYNFYVANPNCPESILLEVIGHYRKLIEG